MILKMKNKFKQGDAYIQIQVVNSLKDNPHTKTVVIIDNSGIFTDPTDTIPLKNKPYQANFIDFAIEKGFTKAWEIYDNDDIFVSFIEHIFSLQDIVVIKMDVLGFEAIAEKLVNLIVKHYQCLPPDLYNATHIVISEFAAE